ncbi:MAG: septal ring lytic transglycosylase RlpA family protein [Campylobacteraceae bacterium]|jgi:rare lipoprotein A|nr:septal ring lytic transglycosylase RlpA family protein [Campylobacteraceae bacterium]
MKQYILDSNLRFLKYANLFVAVAFLFVGCAQKSKTVGSGSGEVKNSPAVHQATMKPYKIAGKTYYPTLVSTGDTFSGVASWYGSDFHGKKTSNGEVYDMHKMTAAHKTFPMNTIVRVTNTKNNKSIIVRVNDRGPFVKSRIIDLSYAAASALDVANAGTAPVVVEVLGFDGNAETNAKAAVGKQSVIINDFDVQIGAFRRRSGAELYEKTQNNQKSDYTAVIKSDILDKEPIYRVWVRGFRGEDEARDFISDSKYDGAFIVREK